MPTEQRRIHSRGSVSGSEVSADSPGHTHTHNPSVEEPPTPTTPLEVKAKKRKAHFEDDPVQEPLPVPFPRYQAYSAISPISQYCVCPPEPHIPRPRNAQAADITAKDHRVSNPEQSKIIAKEWNSLSEKDKEPWKDLAEQEKIHHQQRYPNYRYQPKRSRRSSTLESPLCDRSDICARCGGLTMLSPTTPNNSQAPRPVLPPVHTMAPGDRFLPHVKISSMATPDHIRRNGRPPPPAFVMPQYAEDAHYAHIDSPGAKKRRFIGGGYAGVPGQSQAGTPYPGHSPYSQEFASDHQQRWTAQTPHSGTMPRPPRPSLAHPGVGRYADPHLPSIQSILKSGKPHNAIIMELPWLNKLKNHNKVSPPLKFPAPPKSGLGSPASSRGCIIAMEGDNDAAVAKLGQYIEEQLKRDLKHAVIVERGPSGPDFQATVADYVTLVHGWHQKCSKMVDWINSTPTAPTAPTAPAQKENSASKEEDYDLISPTNASRPNLALRDTTPSNVEVKPAKEPTPATQQPKAGGSSNTIAQSPRKPILLLHRYVYSTTDQWACRVPILDSYDPLEHWQWFATMWRGVPGADLTVFVKDYLPEEIEKEGAHTVELNKELRTVIVRRDRTQNSVGLEESTYRRVGFEVDEWIRGMGRAVAAPRRGSLV